jgi:hypothetical protein
MEEAHKRFDTIMQGGREAFHVVVPPGGDLRDVVRDALAELGQAFGMAHAVEKARDHRYNPDEDHVLLHPYPFHRWSPLEKELAPPLVVEVNADDLRPLGLVEFLDGWQKIALVVRGKVPPAPLARLVSPEAMVAQAEHGKAPKLLEELARLEGPGIVASFDADAGALSFVQRPGQAMEVDRTALSEAMEQVANTKRKVGIQDLRHLESLATLVAPVASRGASALAAPGAAPTPGTPSGAAPAGEAANVDRLAAWLLARTDLSGT